MSAGTVIVGGGHGGAHAAFALRQLGYDLPITIVGDERVPPYERPPLSKEYLAGEKPFERLLIRPASFWINRNVELLLGERVVELSPDSRTAATDTGRNIEFEHLIWAAGGIPRQIICPGHDLRGVHYVRTKVDVDGLAHEISAARNAVVIGGGFIGLEAAAVLHKLGLGVTVVESLDRVLGRVAAEPLSRVFEAEHAAHGVNIALSATVRALIGENGRVHAVELADGRKIDADLVIVGIGIVPAVDAIEQAGGAVDNGVVVDVHARTSLEGIYAIGDCARRPSRFSSGGDVRLESVPNATDQAMVAARSICGLEQNVEAAPWFWSHQYDLKLQTVGLTTGYDDAVVRGDPATRSFSVVYLRDNEVIAIDAVNRTPDFVQGRKLVERRTAPSRMSLEDTAIPLKDLL